MKDWAWRALSAAREEINFAVGSVMEDLDGLAAECSALVNSSSQHTGPPLDELAGGLSTEDEDAVLRVDDLIPPVPTRAEYEQELPETPTTCRSDDDFELLDFEHAVGVMSFR